jgi:hypothetical protein
MLTRTTTTLSQLLSTLDRTPVIPSPFLHLEFDNLFPGDVYAALIRSLPDVAQYRGMPSLRGENNEFTRFKFDLMREYLMYLPAERRKVLLDVSDALRSRDVAELLKEKFRDVLEARFGHSIDRIKMYPIPTLMRDHSGIALKPHTDTFSKVITLQCYLPPDEQQQSLGTHFHASPSAEAVKRIPFVPNHAYAFPVHDRSFHSVPTLSGLTRPRDSLMLLYYNVTKPLRVGFYGAKRVSSFIGYSLKLRRDHIGRAGGG